MDILQALTEGGSQPLLVSGDATLTYADVLQRVLDYAARLQTQGVTVIALYADNTPDWACIDLACQVAEVCCIPIPLFFSEQQIQHTLAQAAVQLILTDRPAQLAALIPTQAGAIQIGVLMGIPLANQVVDTPYPDRTQKITFTSGSTGTPKGACLSVTQQWAVAKSLYDAIGESSVRHLCVLPLSTLLENIAGIYAPIISGGSIHLLPLSQLGFNGSAEFDLQQLLQTITEVQPTTLILLPQLLLGLVGAIQQGWQAPSSLQYIAVGGGKTAPTLLQAAAHVGLPVYEGYGLSECASVVSLNTATVHKIGSIGQPLSHTQVRIDEGEIVVTGHTFLGYLNEPESWYPAEVRTGDLGHFDEAGYLYIQGRAKNLLVSSFGRNINPEWVESELLSGAMLQQCVVFGDSQPYCTALLSPRDPACTDEQIQQWVDHVNQHLPDYARVIKWFRLPSPLSAEAGLLTDNGRPRRTHIGKHYDQAINALY